MISPEQVAEIRRLFYAEHWKVGTIASQLGVHPDAVRKALATDRFNRIQRLRPTKLDPYIDFIEQTLKRYPRLRATRIYQMIRERGYHGSVVQLRRLVRRLRPAPQREAFLCLRSFAGEQGQVDWAHFGEVPIGQARRRLSCFVLTLSYSRALALEFFFDQSLENFLRGHVRAFAELGGVPRVLLYDNLRSAVLARRGDIVQFHPRLLELCAHYHFEPRPCNVRRGNEKGASSERFATYATASLPRALSLRSRISTVRPAPGATTSLTSGRGRATANARSRQHSRKRASTCCRCRQIPSKPTNCWPSDQARRSMSVSIAMITPFRTRRSNGP